MYNNLKTQVNNYFDEQLNKFTNKLNTITNCETLNHWYYKDMLTDKAYQEVYRENAINQDGLLSETVKTKMLKEYCNNDPKQIIKTLLQAVFVGAIGAAWFYLIALCILLIGG